MDCEFYLYFDILLLYFDEVLRIVMLIIIDIKKRKKIFENLKLFFNLFNWFEKYKFYKIKKKVVFYDYYDIKEML